MNASPPKQTVLAVRPADRDALRVIAALECRSQIDIIGELIRQRAEVHIQRGANAAALLEGAGRG